MEILYFTAPNIMPTTLQELILEMVPFMHVSIEIYSKCNIYNYPLAFVNVIKGTVNL